MSLFLIFLLNLSLLVVIYYLAASLLVWLVNQYGYQDDRVGSFGNWPGGRLPFTTETILMALGYCTFICVPGAAIATLSILPDGVGTIVALLSGAVIAMAINPIIRRIKRQDRQSVSVEE